jgi:hypothetical protein
MFQVAKYFFDAFWFNKANKKAEINPNEKNGSYIVCKVGNTKIPKSRMKNTRPKKNKFVWYNLQ